MNNEHTPGPWSIQLFEGEDVGWIDGQDPCHFLLNKEGERFALVSTPTVPETLVSGSDIRLIAAAPELSAYRQYIEGNLDRIERGGWTPVCFDEFRESEECANAIAPLYCEHCEGNGYVQCDYDETTPCTHCLDGREVAEQEARNA